MRTLSIVLLFATAVTAAPPKSDLFGLIVNDKRLQNELKITSAQLKRMQEIELQQLSTRKLYRHPRVLDKLRFTKGQLNQISAIGTSTLQSKRLIIREAQKLIKNGDRRLDYRKLLNEAEEKTEDAYKKS